MYRFTIRTDERCERNGCDNGGPDYAARRQYGGWDRSMLPGMATRLAVFVASNPKDSERMPTEAFRVCGVHSGVLKRNGESGWYVEILKPIPDDIPAAIARVEAGLRAVQTAAAEARAAYIAENRAAVLEAFLAPAGKDRVVSVSSLDEYGRRFIKVGYFASSGMTPGEAEALAAGLLKEAARIRKEMAS